MGRRGQVLIAILLSGCRDVPKTPLDVPATVDRAALITLDADDRLIESSAIFDWAPTEPLSALASDEGTTLVLGYASIHLDDAGIPADTGPLQLAAGLAGALPPPIWAAEWPADANVAPIEPSTAPALTSAAVRQACERIDDTVVVNAQCAVPRCVIEVTQADACGQKLTLGDCDVGVVSIAQRPGGELALDFTESNWTCKQVETDAGDQATADCTAPDPCRLHVYRSGQVAPARWAELRVALVENAEPFLPYELSDITKLYTGIAAIGYAFDMAVLDDRVVVVLGPDDAPRRHCNGETNAPYRLQQYDLETMSLIATSTVPGCTERLVVDAAGTFLGAYGTGPTWSLARFDREGRVMSTRPVDQALQGAARTATVRDIAVVGDEIVVLAAYADDLGFLRGRIVVFDRETLAQLALQDFADLWGGWRIIRVDPRTIVVPFDPYLLPNGERNSEPLRDLVWFDLETRRVTNVARLPGDPVLGAAVFDGAALDDGSLLLGAIGSQEILKIASRGDVSDTRALFRSEAGTLDIQRWAEIDRYLAASLEIGGWRARVDVLDGRSLRVSTEGADIGYGAIGRLDFDDRGRAWALLPWSAELVRLTVR